MLVLKLLFIFVVIHFSESGGCDEIEMRGSRYNEDLMGVYKKLQRRNWCEDRPSYWFKNGAYTTYLFYADLEQYNFEGWMVSSTLCSDMASLVCEDDSKFPENIEQDWNEIYQGYWWRNPEISFECYSPVTPGVVIAIAIGILLCITLIGGIIYCIVRNKVKSRASVSAQSDGWEIPTPRPIGPALPPAYVSTVDLRSENPTHTEAMPNEPAPRYVTPTPVFVNREVHRAETNRDCSQDFRLPLSPPPAYEDQATTSFIDNTRDVNHPNHVNRW